MGGMSEEGSSVPETNSKEKSYTKEGTVDLLDLDGDANGGFGVSSSSSSIHPSYICT